MSHPATAIALDQEPTAVSAYSLRSDALHAMQPPDASDILEMLFRSECFAEDLAEAYSTQAKHATH